MGAAVARCGATGLRGRKTDRSVAGSRRQHSGAPAAPRRLDGARRADDLVGNSLPLKESSMNHDEVRRLEDACQAALAEVLRRHLKKPLPDRTGHLMAKAAVAVLEAVLDQE
jgi:hypothetical protein